MLAVDSSPLFFLIRNAPENSFGKPTTVPIHIVPHESVASIVSPIFIKLSENLILFFEKAFHLLLAFLYLGFSVRDLFLTCQSQNIL